MAAEQDPGPSSGPPPQFGPPEFGPPEFGPAPSSGRQSYEQQSWGHQRAAPGPGGSRRTMMLAGCTVALVVAAGLIAFVLVGRSTSTPTPASAVEAMLRAARTNDQSAYLKVACQADRDTRRTAAPLTTGGEVVTAYAMGGTRSRDNAHASVSASVTLGTKAPEDIDVPTIKEDGGWKVCFSQTFSATVPTPEPIVPTADGGYDGTGSYTRPCGGQGDALTVATFYAVDLNVGLQDLAADCVYPGSVPARVSKRLKGLHLTPDYTGGIDGPDFGYTADSGENVTVTTHRRDGKWWVIKVVIR